jgi:very-short-patch-repair endonuclease
VARGELVRQGRWLVVQTGWQGLDAGACWKHDVSAALFACSPSVREHATTYRRTAAALWNLDGVRTGLVELAVTRGRPRSPAFSRVRLIDNTERTWLDGLPVTSVERTLLDLGQVAAAATVERALECALRRGYVSVGSLRNALDAVPYLAGTRALRELLAARSTGLPPTESDAETLFVQLARRAALPEPQRQFVLPTLEGRFRIDFAWPDRRLAVEIDGVAAHGSREALTRDLRRQNRLLLSLGPAGWTLLRFTWC